MTIMSPSTKKKSITKIFRTPSENDIPLISLNSTTKNSRNLDKRSKFQPIPTAEISKTHHRQSSFMQLSSPK